MIVLILLIITILLFLIVIKTIAYIETSRYIRLEIERSDSLIEYNHWRRELKALRLNFFAGINIDKARDIVRRRKHLRK